MKIPSVRALLTLAPQQRRATATFRQHPLPAAFVKTVAPARLTRRRSRGAPGVCGRALREAGRAEEKWPTRAQTRPASAPSKRERIAKSEARVLDLALPDQEWSTVGNIPNSVRAEDGNAAEAAKQIDDDTQVIVVCADGSDSAEVAEKLRDDGRDAISIDGGMGSWEDEGYVLQPSANPTHPARASRWTRAGARTRTVAMDTGMRARRPRPTPATAARATSHPRRRQYRVARWPRR